MKRAMMVALLAGGLMFVGSGEANAHDYFRGRSGFGFSISYGNPYAFGGGVYNRGNFGNYRARSFTRVTPRGFTNRNFYRGPVMRGYGVPSYGFGGRRCR